MNPFVSRITNNQSWVLPVSALSLVLGFMIVIVSLSGTVSKDPEQRIRLNARDAMALAQQQQQQIKAQSEEINNLRLQNTRLEGMLVTEKSEAAKELNESLQSVKSYAGLTEIQGPGVLVTLIDATDDSDADRKAGTPAPADFDMLDDQDKIIHDQDIIRVVNELYAAGAEAISVNNLRLVESSAIRCVGPTVLIDADRIASPFKIRAIGNKDALTGGLKMPGGVVDQLKQVNPRMVTIEEVKEMTLPAYSGPTTRRYARDVAAKK